MKAWKNCKPLRIKLILFFFFAVVLFSCREKTKDVSEKQIVEQPEDINAKAEALIKGTLKEILDNDSDLPDSFHVKNASVLHFVYSKHAFEPLWSAEGAFNKTADSLYSFVRHSREFGLFPEDYYFSKLVSLKTRLADTSRQTKLDAALWAYSDLLYSSAFVQIVKDLKEGRLVPDSIIEKDSTLTPEFFLARLQEFKENKDSIFAQLEPQHTGYRNLKTALEHFLSTADFKSYTYVRSDDSLQIPRLVYKRLREEDSTLTNDFPDSLDLARAVKKFQKKNGLTVDGKIGPVTIKTLNQTDAEKFIRIAINMDRYKLLPSLPEQYLWVNIPSYYLQLRVNDSVALKSRVVVGKPATRTPLITSAISNMVTYPKWTIPESIIKKEILPGLKRDPGYAMRKGYSVVDYDGNEVDPYTVKWAKYKTSIPYKVVQGSGDDNALGVLKFNFPNKYYVYLHDTNQRYLFSNSNRALSHGCVRVQAWEQLAKFILHNDSLNAKNPVPVDSLDTWLATKQKKYVPVRKPLPLFIRYFTCDTDEAGKLVFYDDVYGEDNLIRTTVFANK